MRSDGRDSAVPEADVGCCCLLGSRANLDFSGLRRTSATLPIFLFFSFGKTAGTGTTRHVSE